MESPVVFFDLLLLPFLNNAIRYVFLKGTTRVRLIVFAMNFVEESVEELRIVLQTIGTAARSDDTVLNTSIFVCLTKVCNFLDKISIPFEKVRIKNHF